MRMSCSHREIALHFRGTETKAFESFTTENTGCVGPYCQVRTPTTLFFSCQKQQRRVSIQKYHHTSATTHGQITHQWKLHRAAKKNVGALMPLYFGFLISLSVWMLSLRPPNWQPARRNPTLEQMYICDGCQVDGRTSPLRVRPAQRLFAKQFGNNLYLNYG